MNPKPLRNIALRLAGVILLTGPVPMHARADAVSRIVGEAPDAGFGERIRLARNLPEAQSPAEREALLDFLGSHHPANRHRAEGELDTLAPPVSVDTPAAGDLDAIRNDIAFHFVRTRQEPEALARVLENVWRDSRHTPTWRDYALQHLGNVLSQLTPGRQNEIRALLLEAAESRKAGFAGTALHALAANLEHGVDPEAFGELAIHVAADVRQDPGNRTTALLHAADHAPAEAIALAREFLQTERAVGLRMASLHVLGESGGPQDAQRIGAYLDNSLPPLRAAARMARETHLTRHPGE